MKGMGHMRHKKETTKRFRQRKPVLIAISFLLSICLWEASLGSVPSQKVNELRIKELDKITSVLEEKGFRRIAFSGSLLHQETVILDRSGLERPYWILTISVNKKLVGSLADTMKVVLPASYYFENDRLYRVAHFSDPPSEIDQQLAFSTADNLLIVAEYKMDTNFKVDSSADVWLVDLVRFVDASSGIILKQAKIEVDEQKAESLAVGAKVPDTLEFIQREFISLPFTLDDVKRAVTQ